jgi:hypothetical protein
MFDVAVAGLPKIAFKHELDRQISQFVKKIHGHGDEARCLRRILVERFLNGVHSGAAPVNIASGFRATGVRPVNPMIPLTSQFAIEPHDLTLYQTRRTGIEINEMVVTFSEGLNFLCHHELERDIQDADYNLRYRRI